MILTKPKTYTFEEFRQLELESSPKHIADKTNLLYAFFFLNPFANQELPLGSPIPAPNAGLPQITELITSLNKVPETLSKFELAAHYLTNPMDFLKLIAQVAIDLSFPVCSVIAILALCMYVFSGCKDHKPLSYVGLSVASMFLIATILSAFVAL